MRPTFQSCLPSWSICLRVSGAVAPSASAGPISPTRIDGKAFVTRAAPHVNGLSQEALIIPSERTIFEE